MAMHTMPPRPRHPHLGVGTVPKDVSKDIIFDWFRNLDNWNRIDFMCGILDICHPFEVITFAHMHVPFFESGPANNS